MLLEINYKSGKPAYLQIVEQVKYAVASAALRMGDQLPSIRELAEQLRVNRNTIAKAYAELEHEGIVEMQHGKGVFVAGRPSPYTKKIRSGILLQAVDAAVVQAHHFQIGPDELVELVKDRIAHFEQKRGNER